MTKKTQSREELIAQLAALETSTEIGKLKAEITRLTNVNSALLSQRQEFERQLKQERDAMQLVREALRKADVRTRSHGWDRPGHAQAAAAADRSDRMAMAEVRAGIRRGTHDPATGLPFTSETKPRRSLEAGSLKVTKTELTSLFPALSDSEVEVSDEAELREIDSEVEISDEARFWQNHSEVEISDEAMEWEIEASSR